jgi:PAS domain S-box-containing protein
MTNSIAGYQIVEKLCMTSSSGLYRARQEENGRTALLKLFDLEKPRVERHAQRACCQHEYAFFTTLDLPGIRPIALIDQPGCLAIVLRDFAGEALETVSRKKTFTLRECLIVARELAAILGVVHAAHIVHGDLRPANILIASDLRLCLVDFSLAAREAHQNSTASVERDWTHLSPEQTGRMNRPVDHRTDFYSSGIILYRLFTGQSPFEASDPLEWAHCHIARLPRSPQEVTPALPAVVSDLIMKLLAKVAEERYQSARGLQYDLECCIERMDTTNSIGPFVLGTRDASDRFYIPQKLYGRETELNQLWAAFERMVATRQPALIVVAGASGVGKSVLVHELHRPVVHEHGYFVAGKFAQYQKGIPYAAIVDACQELVRQMMAESEARVAAWKQQLRAGLDVYAQLLIDLMPQLEPILGPQPPVERLAPLEVQQHFQRVFRLFLGSFAAEDHPLVVFLDDMQWADAASLSLIEHVLMHPDTRCLMLVAAYRDNEVEPTHPLLATIDTVGKAVVRQDIRVGPLRNDDLCQLLGDTLHCGPEEAQPLATMIQRKTNGNAFFINQFLRTLYRDGAIVFEPVHGWGWEPERILAAGATANVVEWMAGQISRLAIASQAALRLAACIGHQFDVDMLAQVANRPPADMAAQLEVAVQQGFLLVVREADEENCAEPHRIYRWSHDRVQQAAYSLTAPDERIAAHLRIGRALMAAMPENRTAGHTFEVVGHLNSAAALVTDPGERRQLARFNLAAARQARRATACAAARDYATSGVALLPADEWQQEYELAFALHRELIEAHYLCDSTEQADALLNEVLRRSRSDGERADLLRLRVLFAMTQQRDFTRSLQVGLDALNLLGVDLPTTPEDRVAAINLAFDRIDAALSGIAIEALFDRPLMTDPVKLAVSDLLVELMVPARIAEPYLLALLALKYVELSLAHGFAANSPFAYANFSVILYRFREDIDKSFRFAKLARRLLNRFNRPEAGGRANAILISYLEFWREPLASSIIRYRLVIAAETEYGNLQYAGYARMSQLARELAGSARLDHVAEELAEALVLARRIANRLVLPPLQSFDCLVVSLRGPVPGRASASAASADEVLFQLGERTDEIAKYQHLAELKRFVLFGDFDAAQRLGQRPGATAIKPAQPIFFAMVETIFYQGLAAAATYAAQESATQQKTMALLHAEETRFARWAQGCPTNFACFHLLLAAELARLNGDHPKAIYQYERAIAAAAEFGLPNMQGLAAERAAAACETRGCVEQVRAYLEMASTAYAAWGADRKAAQLHACATQFAERLTARLAAVSTSQFHDSSSPPTPQVIPAPLDVLSVAKVSQAISGEIVLKKLLDTLMRVVIENAGAQKGCLILLNEAGPFLAAEARVEEQHVTVRQPKNNVPASVMPESVLNYVRRSRERVLIADALETNRFSGDPYLLVEHPRSLLCLPILRQGELIGMLYLEHRLVSHVFTPDRLAVLELLASQAAISLENAQLYTELKERESRFRRLAESNIIGVFFWHMDGSISEANEAFLKMVGYTSQELRENKLRWGGLTPPEYGHADERALDEIRRTGACSSYEKEYIRQDGSRVPILIGGALIEGSQDAGIAFVLDLTERKQAEAERAARKAAEAAIEAKSAFLANVSHELRSPLNIMLGFGRFLTRHSDLPPAVKEDLCIMLRNGEHLHTLINQVLDLAKVEAGRSSIEKSDFDLHRLLDELEDMFAFKAEDNGLLLQFKHRDVPRFIRADPLKLRQVLINLLSNALKFTSEGRVTLSATPIAGPGGMRMQFCVSDTGIGIGSDELTNLFNPFVQASAGLRAQEGTGLGLAISRSFVRMMGGDIHIESAPGEGTTVSFDIPVQVAGAEAVAASTVRSSRRVVGVKSGQQSYRILVVDDRQDARQLLLRLLTPLGFNVREAGNGQEAVNASRMWRPHLVWMDLRMPVMDGLEAARRIKATTEARDTVIIALTASSYEEERADILAAGCDDFLRKPFEENELFGLMQKHLAVTFAYEDDDSKIRDLRSKIDSAALEALPEDVRRSLEQALIQLDAEALATAIGEVPHAPLAQALETLAHEFQYSKMLQLIHGADGKD